MKLITLVSLTGLALTFAACNKQEEAREAALESRADKLEDAAKATENAAAGDANTIKKQGEAQAEGLKDAADKTREQK